MNSVFIASQEVILHGMAPAYAEPCILNGLQLKIILSEINRMNGEN